MQVDDHAVMEMVRRHLSPQDGNDYRVYYDKEIKNSGEPVRIGLRECRCLAGACVCSWT